MVWAEQERESNKGGLFSSAHTGRAAAFTQSEAHGRGSHLPPALPAFIIPSFLSGESTSCRVYGSCVLFGCISHTLMVYGHGGNMRDSVAYADRLFIGSVDCDARFTYAVAKASFHNMSNIKKRTAPQWLWAVCVSAGWFRGAISQQQLMSLQLLDKLSLTACATEYSSTKTAGLNVCLSWSTGSHISCNYGWLILALFFLYFWEE